MTIYYPEALWLFLLFVPLIATYVIGYFRGRRSLRILGGDWREQALANVFVVKRFFMALLSLLFLASVILALAGFSWRTEPVKETRQGMDIVFALDLSRSMTAQDISPSRLDRALLVMDSVLQGLPGNRFGLVGFKGEAQTLVPLTEDREALRGFFDYLGPAVLSATGSNLEAALEEVSRALESGTDRFQVVLLFSDGEGLEGNPQRTVRQLRDRNIQLLTLGCGTREGGRIPLASGRFMEDSKGNPVVTLLKDDLLKALATETSGGRYFRVDNPAAPAEIMSLLRRALQGEDQQGLRYEKSPQFRPFLWAALFFFLMNLIVRGVRWKDIF